MDLDQETYNLIRDTNSDVKHIRELLENCQEDIRDHEIRLRSLEGNQRVAAGIYRGAAKVAGAVALVVSLVFVGLQVLVTYWRGG